MATILQILERRYAGLWTGTEGQDSYSGIHWAIGVTPPSEVEMRAFSAAVDAEIAADELLDRQQDALLSDSKDAILKAIERIINGEAEIKRKIDDLIVALKDASFVGNTKANLSPWNSGIVANIQAVLDRINQIRQIT